MAWAFTPDLLASLSGGHEMAVQVDVFTSAGIRAANVPIEGGTINATLLSDVCRSGTITVARRLIDQGLFDPDRDRVRVSTGVKGYPLIPIFTGRVIQTSEPETGLVSVSVDDFGQDIVKAVFEQPWEAAAGSPVATEMVRLIRDVNPLYTVDVGRALNGSTPQVVWDENRAGALDELAAAINCVWQSDRSGGFVVYPNPYNLTTPPPLVLTLSDGPGGTLTSCVKVSSRDDVYNSVTVLVERADNAPPIRITVRDTDPGSPYFWGGEFGKQNRVVRLNTPGGVGAASLMAQRLLTQSLALARSWRIVTPHFPLLDPGDVIGVRRRGEITAQVVESITYPLDATDSTSIGTRELRRTVEAE